MKFIPILIALFAVSITNCAQGAPPTDFELAITSLGENAVTHYTSRSRNLLGADLVRMWVMVDMKKTQTSQGGHVHRSQAWEGEFNCTMRTIRMLRVVYYEHNLLGGRIVKADDYEKAGIDIKDPISPQSSVHPLMHHACAWRGKGANTS